MKSERIINLGLASMLGLVLLLSTGCLELVRQRITIHHDQQADKLHLLVHYDGIHDSGRNQSGNGEQQLAKAVKNGEAMLMDWPFHFQPTNWRQNAQPKDSDKPQEKLAKVTGLAMLDSISVEVIGYHRTNDGMIGGSQLITIKNAKTFIKNANIAINAAIGASTGGDEVDPKDAKHTFARMRTAATKGHAWLALEGHAIVVRLPIHNGEWALIKAQFLTDLPNQAESDVPNWLRAVQALSSSAFSYEESAGLLTVKLGAKDKSSTWRLSVDHKYKANLEEAVKRATKVNVDDRLAGLLIAGKTKSRSQGINAILNWGPPEEQARALFETIKSDDAALAAKAAKALAQWGQKWNAANHVPEAPTQSHDAAGFSDAWRKWLTQMTRFPLVVEIPSSDQGEAAENPATVEDSVELD